MSPTHCTVPTPDRIDAYFARHMARHGFVARSEPLGRLARSPRWGRLVTFADGTVIAFHAGWGC